MVANDGDTLGLDDAVGASENVGTAERTSDGWVGGSLWSDRVRIALGSALGTWVGREDPDGSNDGGCEKEGKRLGTGEGLL